MTKYRIRLATGRVIGPFEKHQLFDLKTKGHIKGDEEAQIFPTGNWGPLTEFDFYEALMDENKTIVQSNEVKEETFVIDLTKLKAQINEKEIEELVEAPAAPLEMLTETIRLTPSKVNIELEASKEVEAPLELEIPEEEAEIESHDKTLINPIAQQEIERMRREQQELEAKKLAEEQAKAKAKEEEAARALIIAKENAPASPDESTQMFRLDKSQLLEKALEAEQDIDKEFKKIQKKRAKEESEENEDEESEADDTAKAKKKKLVVLVIAGLAIAYALLFPEEKPKKPPFKNLEPKIVFPIPFDQADAKKSQASFNRGLEHFNKGTYPDLIKAGLSFKESYENNLENNLALNYLVRTYSEELGNSSNKLQDAQTVFNIVQSKRPFLVQDANGVIGLNLFYMGINKQDAAIDVVQKYLKLKPKEITQDLFATYLHSLVKRGKIDLARQFFLALDKAADKNRYAYAALIEYLLLNQESDKAMEYVDDAIKRNPRILSFKLTKAELLIKKGNFKEALAILNSVEEANFDSNNKYRAKFLELRGLIYAYEKDSKKATAYLTKSLELDDSTSLRMNLATLETTGGASAETDKLINESKAIKHLLTAQDFYEKRNYELALSSAAKASDAYPGHIPSELFLAKVQLKLGLASQGLKTLQALLQKYPDDKNINLAMIDAYVDTYKFHDARNRIQIVASTPIRDTAEFASANARLFLKMGDTLQAMSWLKNAISLNPLNDKDIFLLAETLLRKGNIEAARTLLNKCMELDPVNPEYRITYARLIYETQDDMSAIGYLLSLQDEFGENPQVMSEIAIFYYRAGKVKDFQDFKAKLEKNHSSDKSLYEFLIKAALMDDRLEEIPGLVEKLLAFEPGDLEQMMTAGRVLFESGKLVDAARWFKRIEERLPTYPRVLYYLAKIDFLAGNPELALKKIDENIKVNGENDADLVLMAQIKNSKSEFVDAENLFKKAQKLNPKSYEAIVGLADISTKRNNHDLALDLYKRALKIKSDEAIVHKKIGDVYRQLGQGTLAIESYKMYLEMDPESPHKRNLESYIQLMK